MLFTDEELLLYTAASNVRARELIALAEGLFGPMTSAWTYDGIVFRDHPPHLYYWPDSASVQISLSFKAVKDDLQRDFQLAHEVCHLLYPSVDLVNPEEPQTNVINEGISTYFSVLVVEGAHGAKAADAVIESLVNHSPRYLFALKQVTALLRMNKDTIRKIREIQPMINRVTEENLRVSGLSLSEETCAALAEAF